MKSNETPPSGGKGEPLPAQGQPFNGVPTPKSIAAWAFSSPAFEPIGDWGIVTLVMTRARRSVLEPQVGHLEAETIPMLGGDADVAFAEIAQRGGDSLIAILASPNNAPVLAILTDAESKIVHLMFEIGKDFSWTAAAPHPEVNQAMLLAWFDMQTVAKAFIKKYGD